MRQAFVRLLSDQSGATAIEYGIIVALVAAVAVPAASILGGSISEAFSELSVSLAPDGPGFRMR